MNTISKVKVVPTKRGTVVFLSFNGKEQQLGRSSKQFLIDLQESFLIDEDITSIKHPSVRRVFAKLRGATVSNKLDFYKAGADYKIEKGHPALSPDHSDYGTVVLGQVLQTEKDGVRVVGREFLNMELSASKQAIEENAFAYASMRTAFEGFVPEEDEELPVVENFQMEGDLPETTEEELTPAQKRANTLARKKALAEETVGA